MTADETAVDPTHRPTVVSSVAAVLAAAVAVLLVGLVDATGVAIGVAGVVVLTVALVDGRRDAVDLGALLVFAGVLYGGLAVPAAVESTLLGTVSIVLAWDRAHAAIDLGQQLGREPPTRRLEAVGFASSLLVGLGAATLGYAVYVVGVGGQPVAALVLLLLTAVFVTIGLGTRRRRSRRTVYSRRRR